MEYPDGLPGIPYIPAGEKGFEIPLERMLPPCPNVVFARWLNNNFPAGSWVVDPAGNNPLTALQAAQAGYRVLSIRSHPITHFMLETIAKAPSDNDFSRALNEMLRTRVGSETLAIHLQGLYETVCPGCGQSSQAQGFIWEKGQDQPKLRLVDCPKCGQKGEFPPAQADLEKIKTIDEQKKMTRARARQKVLLGMEGSPPAIEESLDCYLNRPLYFLMTCINKVDGLMVNEDIKHAIQAILLHLMDAGNNLWHWPPKNDQPHTLNPPAVFLEKNLWMELRQAVHLWTALASPIPITHWPQLPPESGGICLYPHSKKVLNEIAAEIKSSAMIGNFSRPNPAWLALSVLWSSWLWGMPAVERLRHSLEIRRYDWRWSAAGMQTTFRQSEILLSGEGKVFASLHDPSPSSLFACICSARTSHLKLKGIAMREEKEFAELEWAVDKNETGKGIGMNTAAYSKIILRAMEQRGEPLDTDEVMSVCRLQHALNENLPANLQELDEKLLDDHQEMIKKVLQTNDLFINIKNTSASGGNHWWLAGKTDTEEAITDRAERFIVSYLQKEKPVSPDELDQLVCRNFRGLFIPARETVFTCLKSYATPLPNETQLWKIRREDMDVNRGEETSKAISTLKYLGVKSGCHLEGENPLTWLDGGGNVVYKFFIFGNAIFSGFINKSNANQKEKSILVFPASRSRLILYKLKRNAFLQNTFTGQDWKFLKFRHIQKMAAQPDFNKALWDVQLDADPPDWDAPVQLQIL